MGRSPGPAPVGFLDPSERKAVGSDAEFRPSLYKVMLFQHVSKAIKSGSVSLTQSHKYRPLDDYLIRPDQWRRERSKLLEQAGMAAFSDPDPTLLALKKALDSQFVITNKHIADGTNIRVKQMPSGDRKGRHTEAGRVEATTLSQYFPQTALRAANQILSTVNEATGFTDSLAHLQQQDARPVTRAVLFAGVSASGVALAYGRWPVSLGPSRKTPSSTLGKLALLPGKPHIRQYRIVAFVDAWSFRKPIDASQTSPIQPVMGKNSRSLSTS